MGDDCVADVQFLDARKRGNALHVGVVEAMAGIHDEAMFLAHIDTFGNPLEFGILLLRVLCIGN